MGIGGVTGIFSSIIYGLPEWMQKAINLFLLVILAVLYAIFIWKLYRFIARKNIFELNLSKYNTSEHPFISKFLGFILYVLEYLIIFPFLIFFWFAAFGIFLILMTQNIEVGTIIIMAATIVGAIRVIAYLPKYGKDLSKEIAKLFPLTLLAVSMITPNFFDFGRIIENFGQVPEFMNEIALYLLFILFLETVLRIFSGVFQSEE